MTKTVTANDKKDGEMSEKKRAMVEQAFAALMKLPEESRKAILKKYVKVR